MTDARRREAIQRTDLEDGAIWKVSIAAPKANILDGPMIDALTRIFSAAGDARDLKAVLIEGEGANFSFGASVPEHLPDSVERMLPRFHEMFTAILDSSVFHIAAVRGQCLGGGLELASFCHRVVASPYAKLGQPEIVLGVFAPVASVALAERVGRPRAEDLCLSGRIVGAEEALSIGLVDEVSDDPTAAALDFAREFLLPRSASSLRLAIRAVRAGLSSRFAEEIARVEKIYLEDLMATRDAVEGLQAFLGKREPEWSNS